MAQQKRLSSGKAKLLLIILLIVLAAELAGIFLYMRIQKQVQEEREQLRTQYSFYQLLENGYDVNVLIVGDSIGAGAGAADSDNMWANSLAGRLKSEYGGNVDISNVSMGGNTSYAGYVRTMALNNDVSYDLVVICYGQNDSTNDFSLYYESVIRAIKKQYPKASVICILESSQKDYTEKIKVIQSVADHYGLPVADTIEPFRANYDDLVTDGIHPNNDGQKIYCDTVFDVIKPLAEARRSFDPADVAIINEKVTVFDTFRFLPASQFRREGNTFILDGQLQGTVLGIDYSFTYGENSCRIYIDGEEYASSEFTFNYDLTQRHIIVLNKWSEGETVNVQDEIRVVFSEDENGKKQANEFNGLALSGP